MAVQAAKVALLDPIHHGPNDDQVGALDLVGEFGLAALGADYWALLLHDERILIALYLVQGEYVWLAGTVVGWLMANCAEEVVR